uniref:Protein CHUP1, chloroplastic-like n=2 Tax=Nicotiana sylvestris TaxID=4096 RepID=A0A1U7WMK0_NICSY|nr:PREDICTED: protein CHUP1, chloroplastic-like [Nicotiana sylvestris]
MGNEILVAHAYNTGVQYFDMRGEVDEEDDYSSTYGSDVTYNHMSNMHRKFLTKAREEVLNVEHTSEDINFDVEELACSRWITTCLKYEEKPKQLRLEYGSERVQGDSSTNKLAQGARVARDLSRNLSRRSEEKAKQLILDYAGSECRQGNADLEVSFSPPSSPGGEDIDITPNDRRYRNSSKKSQFYSKLNRLIGQE